MQQLRRTIQKIVFESVTQLSLQKDLNDFLKSEFYDGVSYKDLTTSCDLSKGNCDDVSEDLIDFLKQRGYQNINLVLMRGPKFNMDDAHSEWKQHWNPETNYHAVVQIGNKYIDLTASQFSPKFSGILILSKEQLEKMWNSIDTLPQSQ